MVGRAFITNVKGVTANRPITSAQNQDVMCNKKFDHLNDSD